MVEKVAEQLPRRRSRRGPGRGAAGAQANSETEDDAEEPELPRLEEQYVITTACCSFLVRELSRMYNKDFSRVSKAAQAAHAAVAQDDAPASTSAQAAQPLATVLSVREYELIYFMLRVLGHVTSLVEECESTRMCRNGNDLRTNLGKEGLIALVIGSSHP